MKIAVIGLGYVGLPLARLFSTKYLVVGFDVNMSRIEELSRGYDSTDEISSELLSSVLISDKGEKANGLFVTNNLNDIAEANIFIVTVPTPVDKNNNPDLTPLYKASESVGKVLKSGDIVVYESTVYPGVTEEECVPVLEGISGMKFNLDFFVGYSPERINPGDKEHTVEKILKITSGSTPETAKIINDLYSSVIMAGTYLAPSIKVAEAAKVIENAQRDINIAFMNELSKIFNALNIDTYEVLKASSTKWNFLPFKPGLVGGHCIGVDPYYLAQKAQAHGYFPEIILAGRKMNDSMGEYVASQLVKLMVKKGIEVQRSSVLILGFTFKENCPDVRKTKVESLVNALTAYGVSVDISDPHANIDAVKHEYDLTISNKIPEKQYDGIILAVSHMDFKEIDLTSHKKPSSIVYDIKGVLPEGQYDARL
jgi:UDP-N-acetyl-D-galactosamine dehydrogenase